MTSSPQHRSTVLILIGVLKIGEGLLLMMLAVGVIRLLHRDVEQTLVHWARAIRVDPENRFVHAALGA